ncbi:hypothetical protein [Mesorhizobium sp. AR02]|uniref:hypothetical protein n=1 Tax=Mesorhizobium sp. AR02 TaxID=2865837 RepID=UPI003A5C7351
MMTRTLVAARTRLVRTTVEHSNQSRGIMKTFGLLVPAGKGTTFEKNVRSLLPDQNELAPIVLPMLEAWRSIRIRAAELGRQLVVNARHLRGRDKGAYALWDMCSVGVLGRKLQRIIHQTVDDADARNISQSDEAEGSGDPRAPVYLTGGSPFQPYEYGTPAGEAGKVAGLGVPPRRIYQTIEPRRHDPADADGTGK